MIGIVMSEKIVQSETSMLAYKPLPLNFSANIEVAAAAGVDADIKMTLIAMMSVHTPVL